MTKSNEFDSSDSSRDAASTSVVVLGNPNTGKSTLFNALTGIRQQTGNYPGVTVEKRTGRLKVDDLDLELTDLPGTYSLAPRSPDEMLTVNVLLGKPPAAAPPDLILCVVDASNLERNLFLVSQVLDLNRPTVVAVNMTDVAARNGIEIDLDQMSNLLGVPVVGVQAKRRIGFDDLKRTLVSAIAREPSVAHDPFSVEMNQRISRLQETCPDDCGLKRFAMTRMLFDTDGFMTDQLKSQLDQQTMSTLLKSLRDEQTAMQSNGESIAESESHARYSWITSHLDSFVKQSVPRKSSTVTDQLDSWLTHPVWGVLVAGLVLVFLFQIVFWAAEPASSMIDGINGFLGGIVNGVVPPGALNSLLIDGLINGVGSVLIFLPQIVLLFFILALLEDTGYLARAAFLLDKYLSKVGLSGITLFPLLSSFACAIPGIMATRVIKDRRERLITILIAPLMSCSARLPVYVLLIAAFVPNYSLLGGLIGLQGLTMLAMYLVGIVTAVIVAWVLRKTILRTGTSSFVLELPSYKLPSVRNIWQRVFEGGWAFVQGAGTMIVVVTIIVWAAAYFPRIDVASLPAELASDASFVEAKEAELESIGDPESETAIKLANEIADASNRLAAYQLEQSYLGRSGKVIEPVVRPLGWDWRIGSAAVASFPAREVIVSTMGVIFGLGDGDSDEELNSLRETLKTATWEGSDKPLFTLPVSLSIMVFFALCAQCVSTLAVIARETNSWWWPVFTFVYMTVLAYIAALVTFQVSDRIF